MKKITPTYQGENKGHYSPGILSNEMLYISGQLSIDPDTRQVPSGGIEEHAKLALNNMDRVLREAGLGRESVVHCRIYVTDIEQWDRVNEIYSDFFGEHKPARIVIPVGPLHFGCLIEIEAIAEVVEAR
ncbi:MAG TPA: RidA family protein [Bacilli bacterium]|nr:RidA family protein [Bacilli bacterium]